MIRRLTWSGGGWGMEAVQSSGDASNRQYVFSSKFGCHGTGGTIYTLGFFSHAADGSPPGLGEPGWNRESSGTAPVWVRERSTRLRFEPHVGGATAKSMERVTNERGHSAGNWAGA